MTAPEGILTAAAPCALHRQNTPASGYFSSHRPLRAAPFALNDMYPHARYRHDFALRATSNLRFSCATATEYFCKQVFLARVGRVPPYGGEQSGTEWSEVPYVVLGARKREYYAPPV